VKEWSLCGAAIFARVHERPPGGGAAGRRRRPKERPTVEAMRRVNERNAERKVQRLLHANFGPGDGFVTLTTDDAHRASCLADAQRIARNFVARLGRWYKRRGLVLKYLYVLEQGKSGRWHMHVVVNGGPTSLELRRIWGMGDVNRKDLWEPETYGELASYLVKEKAGADWRRGNKGRRSFSRSQNLVDPPPVRERARASEIADPAPHPGFYVDPGSVWRGVNPATGRAYVSYVELPVLPEPGRAYSVERFAETAEAYRRKRGRAWIEDGAARWLRRALAGGAQVELDIEALLEGRGGP